MCDQLPGYHGLANLTHAISHHTTLGDWTTDKIIIPKKVTIAHGHQVTVLDEVAAQSRLPDGYDVGRCVLCVTSGLGQTFLAGAPAFVSH